MLAYTAEQSAECAEGIQNSFKKYPSAEVVFVDTSLPFGVPDLSAEVSQMIEEGVDFVATCMDSNGVLKLAKEMKQQGLDATQNLPNGYDHDFIAENAQFFNDNSYVLTYFAPFEVKPKPAGLKNFTKWMKKAGYELNENSLAGWINADLLYTGLEAAGPDFTRQKVIDGVNTITDYTADGILGRSTGPSSTRATPTSPARSSRRSSTAASSRSSASRASRSCASRRTRRSS